MDPHSIKMLVFVGLTVVGWITMAAAYQRLFSKHPNLAAKANPTRSLPLYRLIWFQSFVFFGHVKDDRPLNATLWLARLLILAALIVLVVDW